MVIDGILATIDVGEEGDVLLFAFYLNIEEVRWDHIEVLRVEFDKPFKVCGADAVVTEL